ncbi:SH3 domain-containing protein [Pseudooceanicola antarcticus]|uniref:SH3 domain-containing protein n=1 Tax=Pseudooceanicola antarcticus TaxID=1247613 RepID=A0A285IQ28_9RHOB|nr:SH3 domain-containing protein [Pseudooceanicola antarcticus]PJE31402.1 hypothetical protein CVM39_03340 [Pseudooceanicola antarcticus]SNY50119.1 SH3 domain-containing protein [Pseudooceanicola antarcticus]
MFRFMTATTFLLAVLFYQASGGADFEPWQRDTPDYVVASPEPWQAPAARRDGFFVASATASEAPEGIQLASIAGQNDSGIDPILDGIDFAKVTPAVATVQKASAEVPHSMRDMQPAARAELALSADERQAVLLGTIPASVAAAPKAQARTEAQAEIDLRQVTGNRVNLRAGPGTTHDVLGTLDGGTEVEVIGARNGWLHLRLPQGGKTGWMADWLVSAKR